MKSQKPKSIYDRWSDWLFSRSKTRPSNEISYGKGIDKVTMKLPRSVEEQFKMVNMMQVLNMYPADYKVKLEFFNMIAPYGTLYGQSVTMENLGYAGAETYIAMYSDLLLRPLSQGAEAKTEEAMKEFLPQATDSTK